MVCLYRCDSWDLYGGGTDDWRKCLWLSRRRPLGLGSPGGENSVGGCVSTFDPGRSFWRHADATVHLVMEVGEGEDTICGGSAWRHGNGGHQFRQYPTGGLSDTLFRGGLL